MQYEVLKQPWIILKWLLNSNEDNFEEYSNFARVGKKRNVDKPNVFIIIHKAPPVHHDHIYLHLLFFGWY